MPADVFDSDFHAGRFSTVTGIITGAVAMLLALPVLPMLLFARDSRDLIGGVAGAILVAALLLIAFVLVFRNGSPPRLLRSFYIIIGILSVVAGVGSAVLLVHALATGHPVNNGMPLRIKHLAGPFIFVFVGLVWIRRAAKIRAVGHSAATHDH